MVEYSEQQLLVKVPRSSCRKKAAWQRKAEQLFSSPSRHGFEAFARGTTLVLHRAELYKTELDIVALRTFQQREAKAWARKSLQSGGQLYAHEARAKREEKEAQARAKADAKNVRESAQVAKQLLNMAKRSAIEDAKQSVSVLQTVKHMV